MHKDGILGLVQLYLSLSQVRYLDTTRRYDSPLLCMLYSTLVFMLLLRPEPFEGLYPVLLPQSFIIAPPKGLQASRLLIPAAQPKPKLLYCTYGPGSRFPRKRPTEQRCP